MERHSATRRGPSCHIERPQRAGTLLDQLPSESGQIERKEAASRLLVRLEVGSVECRRRVACRILRPGAQHPRALGVALLATGQQQLFESGLTVHHHREVGIVLCCIRIGRVAGVVALEH